MYELKRFRKNGKMYFYIPVTDAFEYEDLPDFEPEGDSGYQNVGMAFDIETTSYVTESGEHRATMYHWQFGIDKHTFTGRTWSEFLYFMELLNKKAENKKTNLIVLVHNLSFEFQFFCSQLKIKAVMSRKSRKVMSCDLADYNITFRCTLFMSNVKLKYLPKIFNLPVEKMDGDLDYSKIRTPHWWVCRQVH